MQTAPAKDTSGSSRVTNITGHQTAEEPLRHGEDQGRLRELRLIQARKLAAAGQLARGLAHDFNNELSVIMGWTQLLLSRGTLPPDAVNSLTHIIDAANRAANLTLQLRAFSRQQAVDSRALDPSLIDDDLATMLHPEKPALKVGLIRGDACEVSGEEFRPAAGAYFLPEPC